MSAPQLGLLLLLLVERLVLQLQQQLLQQKQLLQLGVEWQVLVGLHWLATISMML